VSDTEPTFIHLIDLLTVETPVFFKRDAGLELHQKQGLLQQLREAIFGGMEGGGSSAGYGSRPPIDASAVDLLEEITTQATQALAAVSPGPTPYGHAESYVRLWAGQTDETQLFTVTAPATGDNGVIFDERFEMNAYALAKKWVAKIEGFFNPPVSAEICAPCPKEDCGARYVYRTAGGETTQSSALKMLRDRDTGDTLEARCSSCGATWGRGELTRLGELISAGSKENS